jgi:hypothetical protein
MQIREMLQMLKMLQLLQLQFRDSCNNDGLRNSRLIGCEGAAGGTHPNPRPNAR